MFARIFAQSSGTNIVVHTFSDRYSIIRPNRFVLNLTQSCHICLKKLKNWHDCVKWHDRREPHKSRTRSFEGQTSQPSFIRADWQTEPQLLKLYTNSYVPPILIFGFQWDFICSALPPFKKQSQTEPQPLLKLSTNSYVPPDLDFGFQWDFICSALPPFANSKCQKN